MAKTNEITDAERLANWMRELALRLERVSLAPPSARAGLWKLAVEELALLAESAREIGAHDE